MPERLAVLSRHRAAPDILGTPAVPSAVEEQPSDLTAPETNLEAGARYLPPSGLSRERPRTWRRIGESLMQLARTRPEEVVKSEGLTARLGNLTTKIEARTQTAQQKLDEQRESGDDAIARLGVQVLAADYQVSAGRAERYSKRALEHERRAQTQRAEGGILGKLFAWANRGLAIFFGWRGRRAATARNYHEQGLTELSQGSWRPDMPGAEQP